MESDLLIRQEEVGGEREDAERRWCREMFMLDAFDPDELLPKQPAVKRKLHEQKIYGQSEEVRNQDQQEAPTMRIGMSCFHLTACWRAPDSYACYICGQDDHYELFCPYNYIYGLHDENTCRADCLPGQHTMAMACQNFSQSFVRVNNMPSTFCTWNLRTLFEPFGPLLMCHVPMGRSEVCRGYGVVIFKERGDGERAIDALNGYLVGNSKLRVDWAYAMSPGGRPREKCEMSTAKKVFKKRPLLQGARKQRALGFFLPQFWRFSPSYNMLLLRRRKSNEEHNGGLINNTVAINQPGGGGRKKLNVGTVAIKTFWRDPDAKICWICGDEEPGHAELTCPYNYLSPASYAPCTARLLFWQNETGRPPLRPKELDETTLRRREFLGCFVRVNNLPERFHPEELVILFVYFGPLRSWHVAFDDSGACSGFSYMVFQDRAHAEKAINKLNCYDFGDCKLRVDWSYPCA